VLQRYGVAYAVRQSYMAAGHPTVDRSFETCCGR
jgi:hypothetical protein